MTPGDLGAWVSQRAREAAAACAVTRECLESIIERAMRDAVAEARRLWEDERAAERSEWVWEDRT